MRHEMSLLLLSSLLLLPLNTSIRFYERLARSKGNSKAVVVAASKLLTVVY
jgi:hypothetical protein